MTKLGVSTRGNKLDASRTYMFVFNNLAKKIYGLGAWRGPAGGDRRRPGAVGAGRPSASTDTLFWPAMVRLIVYNATVINDLHIITDSGPSPSFLLNPSRPEPTRGRTKRGTCDAHFLPRVCHLGNYVHTPHNSFIIINLLRIPGSLWRFERDCARSSRSRRWPLAQAKPGCGRKGVWVSTAPASQISGSSSIQFVFNMLQPSAGCCAQGISPASAGQNQAPVVVAPRPDASPTRGVD
jgi:hypothetical protein